MIKTKKSASKRFRIKKNGKVKFNRPGNGHLQTGKRRANKRRLRKGAYLSSAFTKQVRSFLPHG